MELKYGFNFKNKPLIMAIAIFVITCVAGYNMIYKSNIEKAKRLNSKIAEYKKLKSLSQEQDALQKKIDVYLAMRNDSPEPGSFLSGVVSLADSCGIKADSIKAGDISSDGEYKFLPCGLAFTAPYQKLRSFINKAESDKRYMRIDSIYITPVEAEDGLLKKGEEGVWVKVDMNMVGLYFE